MFFKLKNKLEKVINLKVGEKLWTKKLLKKTIF